VRMAPSATSSVGTPSGHRGGLDEAAAAL
jgi:hypothetical protein